MPFSTFTFFTNKHFLTLIGLFLFLGNASISAQITIDETRITDNVGKTYRDVLYETNLDISGQLTEIINALGADQTWDFSNLNYVDSTVVIETLVNVDPNDPYLDNPNLANSTLLWKSVLLPVSGGLPDTTYSYRYGKLENGNWIVNGAITIFDVDGDEVVDTFLQWFSPPTLVAPFPVSYGTEWHDSTSIVQNFMGMEFTSSIIIDSNWVEGWGTVITPEGSAPALRVRNKEFTRVPNAPIEETSIDLNFFTQDDHLSASIVLEDGRAFYTTRRLLGVSTPNINLPQFSFRLAQNYPNPFQDQTTIAFSLDKAQDVQIQVLDAKGQPHKRLVDQYYLAGEHAFLWQTEDLPSGMYLLEMRVGNQVQHRMMNISH